MKMDLTTLTLLTNLHDQLNIAYDYEPELMNELGLEEPFTRLQKMLDEHLPIKGAVIDAEHERKLDDPDLIEAILDMFAEPRFRGYPTSLEEWNKLSRYRQVIEQLIFVSPV